MKFSDRRSSSGGPRRPAPGRRPPQKAAARAPEPTVDVHEADGIRLQKVLAAAGCGSRRACEQLIADGRVTVDGHVVTELGVRISPQGHVIEVDGERVITDTNAVYLAFNKPAGVVTTMADELGRPCVGDYVDRRHERLFHVGRLDADTTGLLLLTNDGDLAHALQHPQFGVPKTYVATVPGPVGRDVGRALREGVELDDGMAKADSFKLIDSTPGKALVELVVHEGRKHIVRRMLEAVGYPVLELTRVKVGPVSLGDVKPGKYRPLNSRELTALFAAVRREA